jgi:GntR family transcriptional regulator of arabinose operon
MKMKTITRKSAVPVYAQLSEVLRRQVKEGNLKSGDPLPSENELSKKFSVSRMTARAALLELEREGLASAVLGKGRFVREEFAQDSPLESKRTPAFTVAMYPYFHITPASRFYFTGLLNGLTQGLHHHHARSKFFTEEEVQCSSLSLPSFFLQNGVDGIIWCSPSRTELPQIQELEKQGLPVVMVNESYSGYGLDYVTCNHYKGANQLVEHLIHLGHRKIGCLTVSRGLDYIALRWKGYLDAHCQNHLSADPRLTVEVEKYRPEDSPDEEIREKLGTLRKAGNWPTAWFVAGGALVHPLLKFLDAEEIPYPKDLSLAVFDEVSLPSSQLKLTCVRQPLEKMGEMAVDTLMKKLQGRNPRPIEIVLDPLFMVGESCLPYGG